MPVTNWGYVLRRYLTGSLTIDEVLEACELGIVDRYKGEYKKLTDAAKGEEIVAYAINSRLNPTHGKLLLEFFEGGVTLSDIWKSYNLQLPLRLSLTRKILNYLKDGYEAKNKITNNAGGSNKAAAGNSPNATNSKRLSSKYLGEDFRVAERWDRSVDTRYSISEPSYTNRMVDISDVMTVAEHKAAMLEEAKRMASEGVYAQKIGRKVVRIYIQGRS